MNLRSPDEIIKAFFQKYSAFEGNIIILRRLFVAASVIRWIFDSTTRQDEILQYLVQVEKYLEGEIDLYWKDGVIKVGRNKKGRS